VSLSPGCGKLKTARAIDKFTPAFATELNASPTVVDIK